MSPSQLSLSLSVLLCTAPCLAADGVPDPGFGTGGAAFIRPDDVEARQLHPYATQALPNGRLLFGGFRSQFNPEVPFEPVLRAIVARMNADGSVDTTFGNTTIPGVAVLPDIAPDSRIQAIHAMQVLADGRIVAAGTAMAHAPATGFVTRLHADGSVDTTFGTGGMTTFAYTELNALDIDGHGRIVVAGTNLEDFGQTFGTVMRLTANGAPDTGFGPAGIRTIDWGGTNSNALDAVVVTHDDRVVLGGRYHYEGLDSDFAVARLNTDGSYDTTFAGTGRHVFRAADIASTINTVQRLALTPDGDIAFAGQYGNAEGFRALVLGRLNDNGTNDAAFGTPASPGYLRPPVVPDAFGVDATDLVVQPDGKLVASATYFSPTTKKRVLVVRATATGTLDGDFATGGIFDPDLAPNGPASEAASLALQPDGALIVAGAAEREEPLIDLAVVRLVNPSLAPDGIFGDGFDAKAALVR